MPQHGKQMIPRRLVTLVLLAAVVFILLGGSVRLRLGEDSFTVKAGIGSSVTVNYADITTAEWFAGPFTPGDLVTGKNTLRSQSGTFKDGSLAGTYQLFLGKNYDGQVLVVRYQDQTLVIGASTVDMQALYNALHIKAYF